MRRSETEKERDLDRLAAARQPSNHSEIVEEIAANVIKIPHEGHATVEGGEGEVRVQEARSGTPGYLYKLEYAPANLCQFMQNLQHFLAEIEKPKSKSICQ